MKKIKDFEKKAKDAMDHFERGVTTMQVSSSLGEKEFIGEILKIIDNSKKQWNLLGNILSTNTSRERIKYLDTDIVVELSRFIAKQKPKLTPLETLFILEKFRFTSYMSLIATIRKVKDDEDKEEK